MERSSVAILDTLAIFVVVFALQIVAAMIGAALLASLFVLQPPLTADPWTIVTSVYAHAGTSHLISNSVGLVLFGWPVARATTRGRFHAFFVTTGAIAGISQIVITGLLADAPGIAVAATDGVWGASGAVFALLGYLIASNRLSIGIGGRIDVPRWLVGILFVLVATVVTITTGAPGVALVAHFVGLLVGLIAGRARLLAV